MTEPYVPTPDQEKWVCLCYLCYPNAKEICELIPGCYLYENEGKWGLMCQPGHRDDHAILAFPDKPWPDPDRECEHEDDEIAAASDRWIDTVCDWYEKVLMSPQDGHFLVESCKQAGWDGVPNQEAHPIVLHWLYDLAGKKLEEYDAGRLAGNSTTDTELVRHESSDGGTPQVESPVVDGGGTGSEGVPYDAGSVRELLVGSGPTSAVEEKEKAGL